MSTPHDPPPDASGGAEHQPPPPHQAGAQPPTESEPAPSAAPSPDQVETEQPAAATPPGEQVPFGMPPPPPGQAGRYVFVPDGPRRGFVPAAGRFVRNRATHLVAAVVVGALIGGGTVAIVDNAANQHQQAPAFRQVGPNGPFDGHRFPGFGFGRGGQGFGN
jgi:pyruvate/2-oxoglutarate dehydrogenase complex dihydrolipoamide acyltransferase (E2) component